MGVEQVTAHKKLRHSLESIARRHLTSAFHRFFSISQNALTSMAMASDSHRLQALYQDAQRQMRVDRKVFEANALRYTNTQLANVGMSGGVSLQKGRGRAGHPLALVEEEDLELMIALDNFAAEARDSIGGELSRLGHYFAAIGYNEREGAAFPMSPDQLLESFAQSLSGRKFIQEVKLLLLKAFKQSCFEEGYRELVVEACDAFAAAGIKGRDTQAVKPAARPPEPLAETAVAPAVEAAPVTAAQPALLDQIKPLVDDSLLSETLKPIYGKRPSNVRSRAQSAILQKLSAITAPRAAGGQGELSSVDVVTRLEQFIASRENNSITAEQFRDQLAQDDGVQVERHADNVIQLVGKTFGGFQRLAVAPPEVHTLMGRCELPLLKMAVEKPEVLDQKNHPIRRLFNEMANYAIGLETGSCEDNQVYQQMLKLSEEMLDEGFSERDVPKMLSELTATIQRDRKQSESQSRRALEEIAAREKINWAHTRVDDELLSRLGKQKVPELVREFAETCWSKVLYMAHLRFGEGSSSWQDALTVFDMLVAHSRSQHDESEEETLTSLLDVIDQRLRHIAFDAGKRTKMLEKLRAMLMPPAEPSVEDDLTAQLKRILVSSLSTDLPGSNIRHEVESAESINEELNHRLTAIRRGSWVALNDEQGEQQGASKRGRLTGIVGPSWKYVFVNNKGELVAERSRARLAVELLDGKVAVLDNSHLFDRALNEAFREIKGRSAAG